MLIIFDVDGTLIGGESVDWKCFDEAFLHAVGCPIPEGFFSTIEEVTAKAIIHQLLSKKSLDIRNRMEKEIRGEYLSRLRAAHVLDQSAFPSAPGGTEVLKYLTQHEEVSIAIATGDWAETISFKLGAAGIEFSQYPMATSTDCYSRADIIKLLAERAGGSLENSLYIGDGLWDYRATQKLGIPFLGVGSRYSEFLEIGVSHALPDLEPEKFIKWFELFTGE